MPVVAAEPTMKTDWVTVDGLRLRIAEAGQGEPLLLVHGWGGSLGYWRHVAPALAARRRVLSLDWPGFGESDKPDLPYSVEWYTGLLGRLLDRLGIASASIAGHSMGGAISATFALRHPERVNRLVLTNALVQGSTAFFLRTKLLTLPLVRRLGVGMLSFRWFRQYVARDFTHAAPLADDLVGDLARGTSASLIRTILSMKSTNLEPLFPELRVPTLVIGGEQDRVLKPSQTEVQRKIPGATVVVLRDCGHIPMVERPEEFLRVVEIHLGAARG